jgi:hypothetical protein
MVLRLLLRLKCQPILLRNLMLWSFISFQLKAIF